MTSIGDALGRLWQAGDDANMLQQDGQWVSWGRVRALADQLDEQLGAAGCRAGGRVAVVLDNRMESVAALIAIMRGDRTLVTISPLQPVERLSADLVTAGAAFVLAPGALWSESELCVRPSPSSAPRHGAWTREPSIQRSTLATEQSAGDPTVAIEMLTSGTTGPAKANSIESHPIRGIALLGASAQ